MILHGLFPVLAIKEAYSEKDPSMNETRAQTGQLRFLNRLEWISIAFLYLALVALALIRLDMTDTPVHLATAKYAFSFGHWPVQNTFSYTYPDYPLFQQYPIYQTLLYQTFRAGGWEALSILHCALWAVIFTFCIRWGGSWRMAARLNPVWLLALLGLQQRMILRPDVLTILLLVILFLLIDSYRDGKKWSAALFVVVQFLMVNSHQLFPLGLGVQGAFLVHTLMVRTFGGKWGISTEDRALPVRPLLLALVGSVLVCFASPIGWDIVHVTSQTAGSLSHHRGHVQEFAYFWTCSYVVVLAAFATLLAFAGFWKRRHDWQPFEVFLWLMGAILLMIAIRGTAYYILISVAIFSRSFGKEYNQRSFLFKGLLSSVDFKFVIRTAGVFCTLILCVVILYMRWVSPQRILGGTQPGIGLALGVWPTHSIRFLKENPPPGKMINMTWYSGNPLIMELFPFHPVFVDPRFEAYPRQFLLRSIQASHDMEALQSLISDYNPNWMVAELRVGTVRRMAARLIKDGTWVPVFADTVFLILVRNSPMNDEYIARHRLKFENFLPPDFFTSEPDLLALQQIRMAELFKDLDLKEKSDQMLCLAGRLASKYPHVQKTIERFKSRYP